MKTPEPKIVFVTGKNKGNEYHGQVASLKWRNKKPTIKVYNKRVYQRYPYILEHELAHIRNDNSIGRYTDKVNGPGEEIVYEIKADREMNRKWLKTTKLTGRQAARLLHQAWSILGDKYKLGTFSEYLTKNLKKDRRSLLALGFRDDELNEARWVLRKEGINPDRLHDEWDELRNKTIK
jgi:hypothetical protein